MANMMTMMMPTTMTTDDDKDDDDDDDDVDDDDDDDDNDDDDDDDDDEDDDDDGIIGICSMLGKGGQATVSLCCICLHVALEKSIDSKGGTSVGQCVSLNLPCPPLA